MFLLEQLQQHTESTPNKIAIRTIASGEVPKEISYASLLKAVDHFATCASAHVCAGDRVILTASSGIDFAISFFGLLVAQALPVPCPAPRYQSALARISGVTASCQPVAWVGDDRDAGASCFAHLPRIDPRSSERVIDADLTVFPEVKEDNLAFLQYTSGSTGDARGVMISYGNLQANAQSLDDFAGQTPGDHFLCCLPLYHDMGIIGNLLQAIQKGGSCTILRPETLLKRPAFVLECIDRYGIQITGGPPFVFEALLKVPSERLAKIDLSKWTVAYVGAEMIPTHLLREVAKHLRPTGFQSNAFAPCYGLAEATLIVSGVRSGARFASLREADGRERTRCGSYLGSGQCAIVDPETQSILAEGQTGEIFLRGPEVARGYWQAPAATGAAFGLSLADGSEGWLRTGDLGRIDDGELTPIGREKELLVFKGENFYPQDIESAARRALPAGTVVAAVGIEAPDGSDRLALVIANSKAMAAGLNSQKMEELGRQVEIFAGCQPSCIYVSTDRRLPTTVSGKLRRRSLAKSIADGSFSSAFSWQADQIPEPSVAQEESEESPTAQSPAKVLDSREAIIHFIQERIGFYLRIDPKSVGPETRLLDLGMDSSLTITLLIDLEEGTRIRLPDTAFSGNPTVAAAAEAVIETMAQNLAQ